MERVAQSHQLRQSGLAQFVDSAQETRNEFPALPFAFVLFQQQVAEALFEAEMVSNARPGDIGSTGSKRSSA